jgi:hypothetical protein
MKQCAGPPAALQKIRIRDSAQYDEIDRSAGQCLEVRLQREIVLAWNEL